MDLSIGDLFAHPDHYLFMFEGDQALFRPMDRDAYGRSIFLDMRIDPAAPGAMRVPLDPLIGHVRGHRPKGGIGWIFHVAHCGSTLLARGLDAPGRSLVLREPVPLRQLAVEAAGAFAGEAAPEGWRDGLDLAVAMLAKRYDPAQPVVVKANVPVNFILPEIMAIDPEAKGLLLHFAWDDYLAAILRSDQHRSWVRNVTAELAPAMAIEVGALDGLSDAELAAALWLAQMRIYARALDRWPQLRSLDAERLFAAPGEVIAEVAGYFGISGLSVQAELLGSYAKTPGVAFDNAARLARRRANQEALASELSGAKAWLERQGNLRGPLGRPL